MNPKNQTKWKVSPAGNTGKWHIVNEKGELIAETAPWTSECEANLLAAAPELLRQLEGIAIQLSASNLIIPPGVHKAIVMAKGGAR